MDEELATCDHCKAQAPLEFFLVCATHNKATEFQNTHIGLIEKERTGVVCPSCFVMNHSNCI